MSKDFTDLIKIKKYNLVRSFPFLRERKQFVFHTGKIKICPMVQTGLVQYQTAY